MMDRNKVEDVLSSIGIPANVKGFIYIPDAMEVYEKNGCDISVTKWLYPEIAKKNKTSPSKVERAIRHAFDIAKSTKGDHENFEKYIGFTNTTNSSALISLYKHIQRENQGPEKVARKPNLKPKEISPELEFTIRKILSEELRRIVYR